MNRKNLDDYWKMQFDTNAKKYTGEHEISGWSKESLKNQFSYFKYYYRNLVHDNNKMILDIGCGPGLYCRYLAKRNKVWGLDYSEEVIFKASNKSHKSIKFTVGNAYNLPYQKKKFDVVLCFGILQTLSRPDKAIAEIARVIKPGGILFISTLNTFSIYSLLQNMLDED